MFFVIAFTLACVSFGAMCVSLWLGLWVVAASFAVSTASFALNAWKEYR